SLPPTLMLARANRTGTPNDAPDASSYAARVDGDATLEFCYLTTRGRVSGAPHEIEIWFARAGNTLFLLSGGRDRSDWVRNLLADPDVTVRLGPRTFSARARVVSDPAEERTARDPGFAKYQRPGSGDLSHWREHALPVAVDLG